MAPEFYEIVLPRPLVTGLHATVRPRRPVHLVIYALGCRELRVDWVRLKDLAGIIAFLGVWDESKPRGEMQEVIEHDLARGFVLICDLKHKLAHPHISEPACLSGKKRLEAGIVSRGTLALSSAERRRPRPFRSPVVWFRPCCCTDVKEQADFPIAFRTQVRTDHVRPAPQLVGAPQRTMQATKDVSARWPVALPTAGR